MGERASLEFDLTFGDILIHKLVQAYPPASEVSRGVSRLTPFAGGLEICHTNFTST